MSTPVQRIGVTGPRGFIAGRLLARLRHDPRYEVIAWDRACWDSPTELERLAADCDTIVHLAGVNRGDEQEVYETNLRLAEQITQACKATGAKPRIVFSSTTQRDADNPYGRGKLAAERVLVEWAEAVDASLTTLVVPNVYGAGCRPHYNSVVATFCHQLIHGETPRVIEDREVEFLWVNDLVERLLGEIAAPTAGVVTHRVEGRAKTTVSGLLATLEGFHTDYFDRVVVPDLTDPFRSSLYTTFLSHVDLDDHRHRQTFHSDMRGDLCEVIKLAGAGQVFFSTTKPGVTRGNHFHTRKIEWFCVVRGEAVIRLRRVGDVAVREFRVRGDSPEFISIPVMHTHSIENVGQGELLTLFWTNELFDADDADTYYEPVLVDEEQTTDGARAA